MRNNVTVESETAAIPSRTTLWYPPLHLVAWEKLRRAVVPDIGEITDPKRRIAYEGQKDIPYLCYHSV
jgi:hypothetical protein